MDLMISSPMAHPYCIGGTSWLPDVEFTEDHVLHKIFNRNTVKISYSCMLNLKQNIDGHNKSILHKKIMPPRAFNCNVKTECPMSGNCLKESVVYQATVWTEHHHPPQTYVGLKENSFKTRYSNSYIKKTGVLFFKITQNPISQLLFNVNYFSLFIIRC